MLVAKFNKIPLGAVATRLNVHATFHMMLCQLTEAALASKVKELICSKEDVNKKNISGYTALHIAAENGHAKAVNLLIKYKADVDAITENKFTCLHCAASVVNIEVLKSLIKARAPLYAEDKNGRSFVHIAAENGNVSVLDLDAIKVDNAALLEDKLTCGSSPLHTAVLAGHDKFVAALLKAGVDVNVQDSSGKPPLAVSKGSTMKSILRSFGAGRWTRLMVAAEQGGRKFEQLIDGTKCMYCVQNKENFPPWFQRLVRFHSALMKQDEGWYWGDHERQNMVMTNERLKVAKVGNYPDYSAAVGNTVLEFGIHKWEIKVDNVCSMWMGISRGVLENDLLGANPVTLDARYYNDLFMLVLQSDGTLINCGKAATVEVPYEQGYSSGQLIVFEMDTFKHTLSVKIDERLVFSASGIDDRDVRPYVCMDYDETAVLVSRHSVVVHDACPSPAELPAMASNIESDPALGAESVTKLWKWGAHEQQNLQLTSESGEDKVNKVTDWPDYSSVVGSEELNEGIHTWRMKLENVQSIWVGIARNAEECRALDRFPAHASGEDIFIFAIGSDGSPIYSGQNHPSIDYHSSVDLSSCQTVTLELDAYKHCLRLYIDQNASPVMTASNVDCRGVRPYVCMDYEESVTLLNTTCRFCRSQSIAEEDWCKGFDNTLWPVEIDEVLIRHPLAGSFLFFFTKGFSGMHSILTTHTHK